MRSIADKLMDANRAKIMVIGDIMLDRSLSGIVNRISPEAPVSVVHLQKEESSLGGAGNVATNLANCESDVFLVGAVGMDEAGTAVKGLCKSTNINHEGIIETSRQTTVKERILGKGVQLLRVDYEQIEDLSEEAENRILAFLRKRIPEMRVLVISEYGKGTITAGLAKQAIYLAQKYSIPVVADFKPINTDYFIGASLAILNESEISMAANTRLYSDKDLLEAMQKLSKRLGSNVMVTRGEKGIALYSKSGSFEIAKGKKLEISDVSGAGDASTSAAALGIAAGLELREIMELSNHAGAIICSKQGVSTISLSELLSLLRTEIGNYLWENIRVKQKTIDTQLDKIEHLVRLIYEAYKNHKKILLFGNGGSAADAQHFAAELVGRYKIERIGLPAIALTTDSSIMTAIANDYSYDAVFSRQVEALANDGDVVIGITTSGNSPNVNLAMEKARQLGATTVGLTGKDGGGLAKLCDICIIVPSDNTPRIQETHITIIHIVSELLEKEMFSKERYL